MTCKSCNKKAVSRGFCRPHYGRWYRSTSGYKSIYAMHKLRFGGLREKVIQRDNEACVMCGLTRNQHKRKWHRDITVDHYDMNGRYSEEQNNSLQNLQTLCLSCHGKKDKNIGLGRSVI